MKIEFWLLLFVVTFSDKDSISKKVILDFDPGIDDAFAFLWLSHYVRQGVIDLLAVTTISGNKPAHICCQNALNLLHAVNLTSIPVGCDPIEEERKCHKSNFHGEDGFQGAGQYLTQIEIAQDLVYDPVSLLLHKIEENVGEITLLVLGPLTNIKKLLEIKPNLFKKHLIKEIIVMGGGLHVHGNVLPNAEFNFWYDFEATKKVISEVDSLILIPLDVTTSFCFTEEMHQIQSLLSEKLTSQRAKSLLTFMSQAYSGENTQLQTIRFHQPCLYLHDALVVAYLLKPWLFNFKRRHISIDDQGSVEFEFRKVDVMLNANAWVAHDLERLDMRLSLRATLTELLLSLEKEDAK